MSGYFVLKLGPIPVYRVPLSACKVRPARGGVVRIDPPELRAPKGEIVEVDSWSLMLDLGAGPMEVLTGNLQNGGQPISVTNGGTLTFAYGVTITLTN
jgi:hypothetical protein